MTVEELMSKFPIKTKFCFYNESGDCLTFYEVINRTVTNWLVNCDYEVIITVANEDEYY